jgi:hypothetical protein
MITKNYQDEMNNSQVKRFFSDTSASGFYGWQDWSAPKGLERLVFKVSCHPKYLQAHLERIYYCFQEHLDEQLMGALIDLLIVLNKAGYALGKRLIFGSKSRLNESHFHALADYINDRNVSTDFLPSSPYSLFSKGLEATSVLLTNVQDKKNEDEDPLTLARDFVEYSQLGNAIQVLEKAILIHPERLELHDELLSLYRSTRNQQAFNQTYSELSAKALNLPVKWKQLDDFFSGLTRNEKP